MKIETMSERELLELLQTHCPELQLAQRFSESDGEGGGVYEDRSGPFVRYTSYLDVLKRLASAMVAKATFCAPAGASVIGPVFKLEKGVVSESNEYPDAKLVSTGPWDLENFEQGTELFLAAPGALRRPLEDEGADRPLPRPEESVWCTICKGYGRYQDGNSGSESDGYAPHIVDCDCAPEERRPQSQD